ncbi:hypothetical protein [Marinospirillum celere]|uniref:hypothetical protein n=1 Tax=Marinospirillum celere TaxID=1122252 RepID=UPI000B80C99C|nr:hypothetical protein [Marinospirillum celere]
MNTSSEESTLETLTSIEWKQSLQKHYLAVDSPYGHQPLEWLDVTPEELAYAIGFPEVTQEEVLSAFMRIFSRKGVLR